MSAQAIADFEPLFERLAEDYEFDAKDYLKIFEGDNSESILWGLRWVPTPHPEYQSYDMFPEESIDLLIFARSRPQAVLREAGLEEVIRNFLKLISKCSTQTRSQMEEVISEQHYDSGHCEDCRGSGTNQCTVAEEEAARYVPIIGDVYIDLFDAYMKSES